MISASKIVDEIEIKKKSLLNSFLLNHKYDSNFKKFKRFKTVVIIGMGGSILASKAIYFFLKHKIKKSFIFIDNLDQDFLKKIKNKNKKSNILFLIVSKSGNTSETIINSSYFQSFFNKSNVIIISEKKDNVLSNFAKNKKLTFVAHNPYIGGRYSVFSEVGMVPAYLMGLNTFNFKNKLKRLLNNKKILSQSLKNLSKVHKNKTKVIVLFNYVPELNYFLFWLQQLLAESLGKNKKGFLPIVSNAPKDHHSLLQLYLDGPKDKFFYVFSCKKKKNIKINCNSFGDKMRYLNQKKYDDVKIAQKNAFLSALKEKRIPFREIKIKEFNENNLGELFLKFIFETIALAKIMRINPFDQPAVERVKILTKRFLI